MRHAIFTIPNKTSGCEDSPTEYTAILTDEDKVEVYIEMVKDYGDDNYDFADATFILPDNELKSSHGLSKEEIDDFASHVFFQSKDIIDYVLEEEKKCLP